MKYYSTIKINDCELKNCIAESQNNDANKN